MASITNRKGKKTLDDDCDSFCGSFSGETFTSRGRRNLNRQSSIDVVASRLRQLSCDTRSMTSTDKRIHAIQNLQKQRHLDGKKRWNTGFHNYRFLVIMLGGSSAGFVFLLRYNISIAIINMVDQSTLWLHEHPNKTMQDYLDAGYLPEGEFDWDNEVQHMIMSSYMISYTLPQIMATRVGNLIGNRLATPIALTICAVSTLLTPAFAYYGYKYVIFLRLLNGIGAASVLPMMVGLIENWMPYNQLSLGITIALIIEAIFACLIPVVTGYLASIHWCWCFYGPAALTMVFVVLWLIMVTDRPENNWLTSGEEVARICGCSEEDGHDHSMRYDSSKLDPYRDAVEKNVTDSNDNQNQPDEKTNISNWPLIFKEPSFYAYLLIWCCHCSSYSGFNFIMPAYLRQYLKIPISQNGLYCGIIQSGYILATVWPHSALRLFRDKLGLSETGSRRVINAICCFVVGFTWLYVGILHQQQLPMLWVNRVFHGSHDVIVIGTIMNNYAKSGMSSIVFSVINTVGNFSIVFASTSMGWALDYTGASDLGWIICMGGLATSQLVMVIMYCCFIHAEPIDLVAKHGKNKKVKGETNGKIEVVVGSTDSDRKSAKRDDNFDKMRNSDES